LYNNDKVELLIFKTRSKAYIRDYRLESRAQNPQAFYIAQEWLQPSGPRFKERVEIEKRHRYEGQKSHLKALIIIGLMGLATVPLVLALQRYAWRKHN